MALSKLYTFSWGKYIPKFRGNPVPKPAVKTERGGRIARISGLFVFLILISLSATACGSTGGRTAMVTDIYGPDTAMAGEKSTYGVGVDGSNIQTNWSLIPRDAGYLTRVPSWGEQFSSGGFGFGAPSPPERGWYPTRGREIIFVPASEYVGTQVRLIVEVTADQFDTVVLEKKITVYE